MSNCNPMMACKWNESQISHYFRTMGHLPVRPNDTEGKKSSNRCQAALCVGPDVVIAATRVLPTSGNKPSTLLTDKTGRAEGKERFACPGSRCG
jgi:hypothetical protein